MLIYLAEWFYMLSCKISNEEKDILVAIFDSCIGLIKQKTAFGYDGYEIWSNKQPWNNKRMQFQIETSKFNHAWFSIIYVDGILNQDDFIMVCESSLKEKLMWHADILSRLQFS